MSDPEAARFYTRHARVYDRIATDAPFVAGLRASVVDALDPGRGDVVVEMGCGTGANLPLLRERVGRGGVVIGVDVSEGVLERARARVDRGGWANVHVARADAVRPPFVGGEAASGGSVGGVPTGETDAVLATFVTGMLPDPGTAVDDWCRLVADAGPPGGAASGRVCVAGFARSTRPVGRLLNPAFAGAVRLASPGGRDGSPAPVAALDRRALAAHRRVHERCSDAATTRRLAGFARITAGTVDGTAAV